jgi:hypothetical protein
MKRFIFILGSILMGLSVYAGQVGNGGDIIRSHYIERGKKMVQFLKEDPQGIKFTEPYKINPGFLEYTLVTERIRVVAGPLTDNSQSLVDAIGTPGLVILDRNQWQQYLLTGWDLDKLIFHEMLRVSAYNDDDYRISEKFIQMYTPYRDGTSYENSRKSVEKATHAETARLVEAPGELLLYQVLGDPQAEDFFSCVETLDQAQNITGPMAVQYCRVNSTFEFQACVINLDQAQNVTGPMAVNYCKQTSNFDFQKCVLRLEQAQNVSGPMAVNYCMEVPGMSQTWQVSVVIDVQAMIKSGYIKNPNDKDWTLYLSAAGGGWYKRIRFDALPNRIVHNFVLQADFAGRSVQERMLELVLEQDGVLFSGYRYRLGEFDYSRNYNIGRNVSISMKPM